MNDKNKRIISILSIFTIIFTLMGGTLAYWNWSSTEITGVAFTIDKDFSCSADGGQDINATNIQLQPTADCTNSEVALQRTIKVTPNIKKDGLSINLNMWLKVNNIGSGLAASDNFMYAISTVEGSCKPEMEGYVTSGNFKGTATGSQVELLKDKTYSATTTDTYYLYIWLDAAETDIATANQTFDLSLAGACTDEPAPEAPVLDDGMIPVTIANDGTVTMVSEDDPSWYNYSNKDWANVVLVEENATDGVENSHPRSYYQNTDNIGSEVTQEDILAYYVWIPRYKYRIPRIKCSDIENPTKEEHYSCYTPPYELLIPYNDFLDVIIDYEGLYYEYCEVNEIFDEDGEWIDDEIICTEENWADMREAVTSYADEMLSTGYSDSWGFDEGIEELLSTTEYTMKFNKNNFWDRGPETFDIAFETKEQDDMILGNAITEYRTHPAFWWDDDSDNVLDDDELLPGIWVGKFESNPEKNSDCYNETKKIGTGSDNNKLCNYSTQNPTILPNELSLRYQNVSNQFYTSRNIGKVGNIYGLDSNTINAHMMKNRDWGAVAYLSHSEYGINGSIERNGASGLLTGCGKASGGYNGIPRSYSSYGTLLEYPQSTTGNISGIFDMSAATGEYVMGFYVDATHDYSGFGTLPQLKYYDSYSIIDFPSDDLDENIKYCTIETCGGHALHETAGWYNDNQRFVVDYQPWFIRSEYGGIFGFTADYGYSMTWWDDYDSKVTWRSVLVPGFSH